MTCKPGCQCDPCQRGLAPYGGLGDMPDTGIVGGGIFSTSPWRGQGIFRQDYALPAYMAREPDEGWWLGPTDPETGQRVWTTNLSGTGLGLTDESARSLSNTVRYVAFLGLIGFGIYLWNERMKKRMANKRQSKARRRAARGRR